MNSETRKALKTISFYDILNFDFEAKFLDNPKTQRDLAVLALSMGYMPALLVILFALIR